MNDGWSTTTLESAAIALMEHWFENFDHGPVEPVRVPWSKLSPQQRAYGLGQARAVLMAVRQPSEAILDSLGPLGHDAADAFPAVIDAILNEGA